MRAARFCVLAAGMLSWLPGCAGSPAIGELRPANNRAWIQPQAKGTDLLYVATGDNVYVLTYPKGTVVGSLGVSGNDLCADTRGDVFVPSGYVILEYTHGSAYPSETLHGGDIPLGCAVDPQTGDLAVTQEGSGAGEVAIFPNAQEPSTWYRDPDITTFGLCGYDDRGNLFVDGAGSGDNLAELPYGSGTFRNYPLQSKFAGFGDIAWDGRHITLSNPATGFLYRLRFERTSFKAGGATRIKGWQNNYSGHWPYIQTMLQDGTFVAQSSEAAMLGVWCYPAGDRAGTLLGPFAGGNVNIYGVALSPAPRLAFRRQVWGRAAPNSIVVFR
ncbi:MAG TPA: hypothetical protein VGI15_03125 [Candidatus Cybelea sp.]